MGSSGKSQRVTTAPVSIISTITEALKIDNVAGTQINPATQDTLASVLTALGAISDAAVAAGATGSQAAKLRRLTTDLGALVTAMGTVTGSPTENTLLERQKAIETAITAINTLIGAITASPTQYSLLERLKVIATNIGAVAASPTQYTVNDRLKQVEAGIDEVKVLIGAVTASPTQYTALERLKVLDASVQALLTTLGLVAASPTENTVQERLKAIETALVVSAAGLAKAEDAAHAGGDTGVMALYVRKDKHEAIAGTDLDYAPPQLDKYGGVRPAEWEVGPIELRADCTGWAVWEKIARNAKYVLGTEPNRQFRQGPWAIHLNGGAQNWAAGWEDWASAWIPINEMKLTDLDEIMYTYYKFLAGTADVGVAAPNIAIRVHDPANHDARAEITLSPAEGAAVTEGWHETIMNSASSLYYYGDNVGSPDICTGEGPSNPYTWANFQADVVFSTWTVYQIDIDYGFWGSARSTGDVWIGSIQINDIPVKMEPADLNDLGTRKSFSEPTFGEPTLIARNNGDAVWSRSGISPYFQKGSNGWLANLYGGIQKDWISFAAMYIPVNELPVPLFNTARWSYFLTEAEAFGINMVIWVHDPYDHDIRAEITQKADIATLEKTIGWCAHELNQTTDQFYYYGEGIAGTSLITGEGPGNLFGWDDFQGDERFNTMTIYRISFEYGWHSGDNEFKDAWLADIVLNNRQIPLKPDSGGSGRIGHRYYTLADTFAATLAPKTAFRLLSVSLKISAAGTTSESFTITNDAGVLADIYDVLLYTINTLTGGSGGGTITALYIPFGEGYEFAGHDEIDFAWPNTEDRTIGLTAVYQTVF